MTTIVDHPPEEAVLCRAKLGSLEVSRIGLGCMGMAEFYGDRDEAESIRTIHEAVDLGMDFLDTADMYGAGLSEEIVGRGLAGGLRDRVVPATKCGLICTPDGVRVDGSPKHIAQAVDASLRRLGSRGRPGGADGGRARRDRPAGPRRGVRRRKLPGAAARVVQED